MSDENWDVDGAEAKDDAQSPVAKAFDCVKKGDLIEAARLTEETPSLWHEQRDGYTVLHWGALAGANIFVSKGLEAGAPVDSLAPNKQTPLMWATTRGHIDVMRTLIEAQADIYARDSLGATPLLLAVQHQQHVAFLLLVAHADRDKLFAQADDNGCGPAHWASYKGDMTSLKLLEYFDVDFNGLDTTKMTPLHRAVQSSQTSVIETLFDKQVDPSLRDSQGRTCLDLAEENRDASMKRVLNRFLDVKDAAGVVIESNKTAIADGDIEAGGKQLSRKVVDKDKKKMDELMQKAMSSVFATFWLVCVSLSVFQYINDLRVICWQNAPKATMAFELGVPTSLLLFFFTALSDPGKVPARVKSKSGVEELMRVYSKGTAAEVKEADIGRLCTSSWNMKGLRTKYCKSTGACVEEFDHFCGWLNVAIGKGNHRPFMFLAVAEVSTQIVFLYLCWTASYTLTKPGSTFLEWFSELASGYPLMMLMIVIHGFTAPGILMLTFYQLRLVAMNLTTNEMMNAHRYKHFWKEVDVGTGVPRKTFKNIFNKGSMIANCVDFWFTRRRSEFGPKFRGK